jgi:hypothetical protein
VWKNALNQGHTKILDHNVTFAIATDNGEWSMDTPFSFYEAPILKTKKQKEEYWCHAYSSYTFQLS